MEKGSRSSGFASALESTFSLVMCGSIGVRGVCSRCASWCAIRIVAHGERKEELHDLSSASAEIFSIGHRHLVSRGWIDPQLLESMTLQSTMALPEYELSAATMIVLLALSSYSKYLN